MWPFDSNYYSGTYDPDAGKTKAIIIVIIVFCLILIVFFLSHSLPAKKEKLSGGNPCDKNTVCYSGECAPEGTCPFSQKNQLCRNIKDCDPNVNFICSSSGYCSDKSEGSICSSDGECQEGLRCKGKCVTPEKIGFLCGLKIPFTNIYFYKDITIMWLMLLIGLVGTPLFGYIFTKANGITWKGISVGAGLVCFIIGLAWLIILFSC